MILPEFFNKKPVAEKNINYAVPLIFKPAAIKQYLKSFKHHVTAGFPVAGLLALSLLSGCATDPPQLHLPLPKYHAAKSQQHHYRGKHAFNRPYRVRGKTYYPMTSANGYSETGIASWYGSESGSKTAIGSHFSPNGYSAAHKTLPLPSKVRVTNLHNGRSIVVVVNDRGPFKPNRIIDLSHGAARKIGMNGLGKVKVVYLGSAD